MNCKQGDLALVIDGPSTGKVVTCLELLPAGWERDDVPPRYHQEIEGPSWRVDRLIQWPETAEARSYGLPTSICVVPDVVLMPIRPEPDSDEHDDEEMLPEPVELRRTEG